LRAEWRDLELVTVSSTGFVAGTETMLDSFVHNNPWFNGPITIIHDDLDAATQARLTSLFPRLTCRAPRADLVRAIDQLVAERPALASRYRRFFSLDVFDGESTRAALFVDSDVLFRGSVEAVAALDTAIAACGDRALLMGNVRDPETLAERAADEVAPAFRSFNAGFIRISPGLRRDHTDQAVLNRMFGAHVHVLDRGYNLMLGHIGKLGETARSALREASVLHFNGPAKPWQLDETLSAMAHDPDFAFALAAWHAAYRRFISRRRGDGPPG
jgi:lipopolysaccharide biosynthesis glycosyltransferase